jgi:hypothetical protein
MYGFNPYGGYPQMGAQMGQTGFLQPGMNQYPSGANAPQSGMEVVPVPTIQQVVMVQNEPVIAARYADNMGLVTTEFYRLEKYDPHAVQGEPVEYVTRKEFEEFVAGLKPKKKGDAE